MILSISSGDKPLEGWIFMLWLRPVALSWAETLTMPLASISNVTSICGMPFNVWGMPTRLKKPNDLLPEAVSLSPWST